jgi:hypothetical protein
VPSFSHLFARSCFDLCLELRPSFCAVLFYVIDDHLVLLEASDAQKNKEWDANKQELKDTCGVQGLELALVRFGEAHFIPSIN